jgi:Fe-S cluster assembly iron-binding protein IscA
MEVFTGGGDPMLTVTAKAKEKLQEVLKRQTAEPEVALRVTPNHPAHNCLELVLDKEKKGDQVVQAQNGAAVLLIRPDMAKRLSGILIDYRETARGADFIIARTGSR